METFGPIQSRRLGKSLGINNLPRKTCSFSCIYCQAGNTTTITAKRRKFFSPEEIFEKVRMKVKQVQIKGEHIDYLSFVPNGEPTLDINLGNEIELLKTFGLKIAVFTNASLLLDYNVRSELGKADLVSIKIDAYNSYIWRKINKPHKSVFLDAILDGISLFKETFKVRLITETMLVSGINDDYSAIIDHAQYLKHLNPDTAYLAIPTRPPSDKKVIPPNEKRIKTCYHILSMNTVNVEYLTMYEGNEFAYTGDIENDILNIASIHPLREEAITEMLRKANDSWEIVEALVIQKKLVKIEYENNIFYKRILNQN